LTESHAEIIVDLDKLEEGMPGISPKVGAFLAEAATVCFTAENHSSGVIMHVDGDFNRQCRVVWNSIPDEQVLRSWGDAEVATEHGAYATAALMISELTSYTVFERSRKGTGFDYWLAPRGTEQPLFQEKARLEVSGIRKGDTSKITARTTEKLGQTERSRGLPVVVAVVEFSAPRSRVLNRVQ
jgi:hypothetical protein